MFNYDLFFQSLRAQGLADFANVLQDKVQHYFANLNHGDVLKWQDAFDALPLIVPTEMHLHHDAVCAGAAGDISSEQKTILEEKLKALMPWRKGPFDLFGLRVDSEWQCQKKWQRLQLHLELQGKRILDVGCGNGYYMYRMLGAGAKQVLGIDPMLRFIFQFEAIKKYLLPFLKAESAAILPLTMQDMPKAADNMDINFDMVFSMGVLYHRRDPVEHIAHLRDCLNTQGELILETLIIDEGTQWGELLEPAKDAARNKRYAMMGNVWNVPTVALLETWVKQAGFKQVKVCDISITDFEEQRSTEWMNFHSLQDFMDPEDNNKTIEGYPGPQRVILSAKL